MANGSNEPIAKPQRSKRIHNPFKARWTRERDPAAMAASRSTWCHYCGRTGMAIHRHHLVTRGAGGSDRQTIDLCAKCHDDFHTTGRITREQLEIAAERDRLGDLER